MALATTYEDSANDLWRWQLEGSTGCYAESQSPL